MTGLFTFARRCASLLPLAGACTLVSVPGSLSAQPVFHVRADANGAHNGADWANAYTALPSTLVRGATYYVADGTYPGYAFDTPESGTELIIVKKATQSNHGSDIGWVDSYGDGQAVWTSAGTPTIQFSTSYYHMDGVAGSGTSGYGFRITSTARSSASKLLTIRGNRTAVSHLTFEHIDMEHVGYSNGYSQDCVYVIGVDVPVSDLVFRYCWVHNVNRVHFYFLTVTNVLIEHCWMTEHFNDDAYAVHSQSISANSCGAAAHHVYRYNVWRNVEGTGCVTVKDSVQSGWEVYGNLFYNDDATAVLGWYQGRVPTIDDFAFTDHVFGDTGGDTTTNMVFYNNTIVDLRVGNPDILWQSGAENEARNNLWVNCNSPSVAGASSSSNTFNAPADVFVDYAGRDFRLAREVPGERIGSDYERDLLGRSRGADGVVDRGAFEFVAGGVPPTGPTELSVSR